LVGWFDDIIIFIPLAYPNLTPSKSPRYLSYLFKLPTCP
jgi:hypothetical protein